MIEQEVLERIRQLSPAHQNDAYNVVTGNCTLKSKFTAGGGLGNRADNQRATLLENFEEYAGYTIPALFPPEGAHPEEYQVDYQSVGAQLTNNLASKIVTTLFHPARPFFKLKAPDDYIEQSGRSITDIEADLAGVERKAMQNFASRDGRTSMTDLVLQLIVTGNAMLNKQRGKNYRVFSYRDYDATFDTWGVLQTAVIREWLSIGDMSSELANMCMQRGKRADESVQVFTGIKRIKRVGEMDYYLVWQEVEDYKLLSKDYGVYSSDTLPWNPQRYMTVQGRQAGIGLIEQYVADFHMLSKMSQADQDLIAVLTDIKTIVKPNARTNIKALNDAKPGEYVAGDPDDLHSHVHDVGNQMAMIDSRSQALIRRLSQVFLMSSNAIRDAERVTAEEIRYIANELDQVHGGFYSRLARTLQTPLSKDLVRDISPLLKSFTPMIITGLESLSRMSELDNYRGFINDMTNVGAALQGPHAAWINMQKVTNKFASGWGLDINEVMFTPQEKQAEEQRQLELQARVAAANNVE